MTKESDSLLEHPKTGKVYSHDEHWRLGGRPPLKTILSLGIGPMISELVGALYGIIDTIWVSYTIGYEGMSAISEYSVFDNMGRAFGGFLNTAANTKTSQLYGLHKDEEVNQIFSDMFRLSILFSILVPCLFLPICRPVAHWYGAEDELVDLGYEYIRPVLLCACSSEFLLMCGGFLQGEGRTNLFGIVNIIAFCINMGLFDPLFLLGLKVGIKGAAYSTILSELIPAIILLICFYTGRFTVKPDWRGLFRKFSPHTLPALSVGVSQLISKLSFTVPAIIVRKFLGMATGDEFSPALSGYNATVRFIVLTQSVTLGINTGFTPAASYAYASKQPKRWLWLAYHDIWLNFIWGLLTCLLTWLIPRQLSLIFSSDEQYLKWAEPMMQTRNFVGFTAFFRFSATAMLQSLQKGGRAMIFSFTCQFASILLFSYMFYALTKDGVLLLLCYPASDLFGMIAGGALIAPLILKVYRMAKAEDSMNTSSLLQNDPLGQSTYT